MRNLKSWLNLSMLAVAKHKPDYFGEILPMRPYLGNYLKKKLFSTKIMSFLNPKVLSIISQVQTIPRGTPKHPWVEIGSKEEHYK